LGLSKLEYSDLHAVTTNFSRESNNIFGIHQVNIDTFTSPLIPLTERDCKAMAELFDRGDCDEIENDINRKLQNIYPEPCWEDDPYDFLKEYL
jgi:hypothetical protein